MSWYRMLACLSLLIFYSTSYQHVNNAVYSLSGFCVPAYNQIRKHVFVETVKNWSGAQSYCREKHTDLATVRSQEEAEQLLNITGASLGDSWIGLYHDDTQNWQWSNSDDVIYSNWRADVFCASVNSDGKWTDLPCNLQKAFMCYKETSNITERYTLIEQLKTWTAAQQYCREHHTDLISIKNASENEEIVKKAQGKPFWIGLFNEPWKWSHQGDNYTFHTWSKGEPNNRGGDENCVTMSKTGGWNDYGCNNQNSFFCCEGGSSGLCFYEGSGKTWQRAQSYCRNQGRDLPTIQDQARVNKLIGLIPFFSVYNWHWIGLYRDKENWQWSSGGDVIYSNWEPYLFCASVNSEGEWEDSLCSQKTSNITERYTLIEELKTWTEAQQYCREHHTDLVSIKNASENEEIVKKAQGKPFWIGLFNEPWKWSHQGDNYTFHNWSKGEPNNGGGDENCVVMSKTGGWNDYGCHFQLPFFCCEVPEELHLISHSMVWPEAWQYCRDRYTDLVSLTSLAAQNRVLELVRNSTASRFWIGLHRTVVYDNWYWVAGKDKKAHLNYTNWAPGEPNNPYYEHCGEMVLREDGGAEWNDLCCYEQLPFICFKD
ncbi:UNVERIFIED_CONTAM: hypothetical protein FKN15_008882 [Acipenser sinensis]